MTTIQAQLLFEGRPQGGQGGYHYSESKDEMLKKALKYIKEQRQEWAGIKYAHEFPHADKWEVRYSDFCGGETVQVGPGELA